MSSGSDASHFGYGKIVPNSNVNGQFVNKDSSTFSGSFSSNEIPHSCLPSAKYNVDAANAYIPGLTGGSSKRRKTNKNRKNKTNRRMKYSKKKHSKKKHSKRRQ